MSAVTHGLAVYSNEAEMLLLGHVLTDPEKQLAHVPAELAPGHFFRDPHARIFTAVRAVVATGRVPTTDLVVEELRATGRRAEVGDSIEEAITFANNAGTPSPKTLAGHAALIVEMAKRRSVLEVTRAIGKVNAELEAGLGDGADKALTKVRALVERVPTPVHTTDGARPLAWLTAEDLTSPVEEPKYLVDKIALAPGTLCILAGQAFSGKSVVAHELALCIAANRSALGKHANITTPGPVALLDYEMGRALTVRRVQRLARGRGIDLHALVAEKRLRVACFPDVKLTDGDAIDRMRAALEGVSLAVIDSARAMMPGVDENDSAVRTYLDQLTELAEKTSTAIMLIHHAGKLDDAKKVDPRSYFRGSSGFLDAPSSAYVLTTKDDEPQACVFRHIKCRHRGVPSAPFKLVFEDKVPDPRHPERAAIVDRSALRLQYLDWAEVREQSEQGAKDSKKPAPNSTKPSGYQS